VTKKKVEAQIKARKLRNDGLTIPRIASELGVSKSSVSIWLKNDPLSEDERRAKGWNAKTTHAERDALQAQFGSLIAQGMTVSQICNETGREKSSVYHWLSVFEMEAARVLPRKIISENGEVKCHGCGKFFPPAENRFKYHRCKSCQNNRTTAYKREQKRLAVEYKGGQCVICAYNQCQTALDFHHMDPKKKDVSISRFSSFDVKCKAELDKCVLLCCRCHREVHDGFRQLPFI
jgi:transposase